MNKRLDPEDERGGRNPAEYANWKGMPVVAKRVVPRQLWSSGSRRTEMGRQLQHVANMSCRWHSNAFDGSGCHWKWVASFELMNLLVPYHVTPQRKTMALQLMAAAVVCSRVKRRHCSCTAPRTEARSDLLARFKHDEQSLRRLLSELHNSHCCLALQRTSDRCL